jgi:hypothetical protein
VVIINGLEHLGGNALMVVSLGPAKQHVGLLQLDSDVLELLLHVSSPRLYRFMLVKETLELLDSRINSVRELLNLLLSLLLRLF